MGTRVFLRNIAFALVLLITGTRVDLSNAATSSKSKAVEVKISNAIFLKQPGNVQCANIKKRFEPVTKYSKKLYTIRSLIASAKSNTLPGGKKLKTSKQKSTIAKFQKLYKLQAPICNQGPDKLTPFYAYAQSASIDIAENSGGSIRLTVSPYKPGVTFKVVSDTSNGTLSGLVADTVYYTPRRFFVGSDAFVFEAFDGVSSSRATISINVTSSLASFSGNPDSLSPYREELSTEELNQLKKRFFGLEQFKGRTKMSDIVGLIDEAGVGDSTLEAEAIAAAAGDKNRMDTNLSGHHCWLPERNIWSHTALLNYWLTYMVKGNPFKERQAALLTNLLAIDFTRSIAGEWGRNQYSKEYLDLIRSNALKNYDDLLSRMHPGAMMIWLDNRLNAYNSINENYSRETLELFTMGSMDPVTGAPNYTETDARVGAARALSGFTESWRQVSIMLECDDSVKRQLDYWVSVPTFQYDRWMYDPSHPENINLFRGSPWEASAPFKAQYDSDSFTPYILYNHPGSSRNIGSRLFTQFVKPTNSEPIVGGLATKMLNTGYDMKEALKTLVKSEAMYAPEARMSCMSSPVEAFIGAMRTLRLPLVKSTAGDMYAKLRNALSDSGMSPLAPPSVFGIIECGVNRDGKVRDGSVFLATQQLLQRKRHLTLILNTADDIGFDWASLLPQGSDRYIPERVVSNLLDTMGITMEPPAKNLLVQYLLTARYSTGNDRAVTWNPDNAALVKLKIPGIVQIAFDSIYGQLR